MSEMVERVAKAIYPALVYGSDYDEVPFEEAMSRPRYEHLAAIVHGYARAAIEAMREPTPQMIEANSDAAGPDDCQTIEDWQAMIDAALKD